jgi:hypothetical protein
MHMTLHNMLLLILGIPTLLAIIQLVYVYWYIGLDQAHMRYQAGHFEEFVERPTSFHEWLLFHWVLSVLGTIGFFIIILFF